MKFLSSAVVMLLVGCGSAKPTPAPEATEQAKPAEASAPKPCADELEACIDGVGLPASSAVAEPSGGALLVATSDGANAGLRLERQAVGSVDAASEDYLVAPLRTALAANTAAKMSLAIDGAVPFGIVTKVVYTAGQSGVNDFRVLVDGANGAPSEIALFVPTLSEAMTPEDEAEPPLNLAVVLTADGIAVSAHGEPVANIDGCGEDDLDVCDGADADSAYPWAKLYEALGAYREQREEGRIVISAEAAMPWATVTRLIDVVRDDRGDKSFASNSELFAAEVSGPLFDKPMLAVPRD